MTRGECSCTENQPCAACLEVPTEAWVAFGCFALGSLIVLAAAVAHALGVSL